jgi:L-alanine-DL-glutamate epimerase-like enolase superfamily enzyme
MVFMPPGWFGGFDNCLWDIEGQMKSKSVAGLISDNNDQVKAYYNYRGADLNALIDDASVGIEKGFTVLKDHFAWNAKQNIDSFESVRGAVGEEITLLHDAAACSYSLQEAVEVAKQLSQLNFGWFEEPLNDRELGSLKTLCSQSEVPILALETLMNDFVIMREWVREGAVNIVRANARHGTTGIVRIAEDLARKGMKIELNGPGGLFGHVHAQLVAGINNTSYYEYFPDGSRDSIGKEIGLLNPPVPEGGEVKLTKKAGWGYEFDWEYFNKKRVRVF